MTLSKLQAFDVTLFVFIKLTCSHIWSYFCFVVKTQPLYAHTRARTHSHTHKHAHTIAKYFLRHFSVRSSSVIRPTLIRKMSLSFKQCAILPFDKRVSLPFNCKKNKKYWNIGEMPSDCTTQMQFARCRCLNLLIDGISFSSNVNSEGYT